MSKKLFSIKRDSDVVVTSSSYNRNPIRSGFIFCSGTLMILDPFTPVNVCLPIHGEVGEIY